MDMDIKQGQQPGGALVQMNGSVSDMAMQLGEMKAKIALVQQFFNEVMVKEVDYGKIPGTDKPALLQPGADKLVALYNFSKVIADKQETKDYATGHYDVTVKVRLVHRATGCLVSEGEGSCSTRESKYQYRWVYERDIPKGINPVDLVYKEFENKKTGAKWTKYRIENEDLFSLWNTVLKMAVKRAYIAATLSGTGLSGLFSQEEDELDAWIEGEVGEQDQNGNNGRGHNNPDKKDLAITVTFGQYKGQTLGDVLEQDPSYLKWLADKAQDGKIRKAASNLLKAADGQGNGTRRQPPSNPPQNPPHGNDVPPPGDDEAPPDDLSPGGEYA